MTTEVFWAPVGASLERGDWRHIGVVSAGFVTLPAEDEEWLGRYAGLAGRSVSLKFTLTKREARRLKKFYRRTPAEIRQSVRRSAYHHRQKRRARR